MGVKVELFGKITSFYFLLGCNIKMYS